MGPACCRALADLFLRATAVRYLVGIPVGIRSNRRLKLLQIQLVMRLGDCRPGAPPLFSMIVYRAGVQRHGKMLRVVSALAQPCDATPPSPPIARSSASIST